ncbi:hypothetical protein HDU67_007346, partial [Dinochytrium kinnereticum]
MDGVLDENDPRYKAVHSAFHAPAARILLDLPILPRIAPTPPPPTSSFPFLSTPPPNLLPTSSRTTRRIAISITGDPNGIPMIVHGGMNCSRFVGWLLHDLGVEHGIKIIVPDRPGMGLSEPWDLNLFPDPSFYPSITSAAITPWRGGFLDWAEYIRLIIDHLGLKRVALMGMSCGCVYSLAFAKRYPERLLPVPLQLFACWLPPSLPECSMTVRSSCVLPTTAVVSVLASAQRLVLDPGNLGVVNGLTKAAK